jgi:hypothetical protein
MVALLSLRATRALSFDGGELVKTTHAAGQSISAPTQSEDVAPPLGKVLLNVTVDTASKRSRVGDG